jgi:hypothetical protein
MRNFATTLCEKLRKIRLNQTTPPLEYAVRVHGATDSNAAIETERQDAEASGYLRVRSYVNIL